MVFKQYGEEVVFERDENVNHKIRLNEVFDVVENIVGSGDSAVVTRISLDGTKQVITMRG